MSHRARSFGFEGRARLLQASLDSTARAGGHVPATLVRRWTTTTHRLDKRAYRASRRHGPPPMEQGAPLLQFSQRRSRGFRTPHASHMDSDAISMKERFPRVRAKALAIRDPAPGDRYPAPSKFPRRDRRSAIRAPDAGRRKLARLRPHAGSQSLLIGTDTDVFAATGVWIRSVPLSTAGYSWVTRR
jgi:hypothetical protein